MVMVAIMNQIEVLKASLSNAPVIKEGNVVGVVSYSELVFKGLAQLID